MRDWWVGVLFAGVPASHAISEAAAYLGLGLF
jgi:hypothetical protein